MKQKKAMNEFNYEASIVDGRIVKGDCTSVYQYRYDRNGNVTEEFWEEEMVRVEHEYDKDGREILYRQSSIFEQGMDDSGIYGQEELLCENRTVYDAKGHAIECKTWSDTHGGRTEHYHYAYEYDSKGRVLKETESTHKVLQIKEYEYNGEHLCRIKSYNAAGTLLCAEEYDAVRNKIAEYDYSPQRELQETSVYRYDDHNNLIYKEVMRDSETIKYSYAYTYDSEENWICREGVSWTDDGNKTHSVTEKEIEYYC